MAKLSKKQILQDWGEYRRLLMVETEVANGMSHGDFLKHKQWLEDNPEEWIRFFFPSSARYPFAPFHKKFFKRIDNNPEWYETLSWARELAKSSCVMFETLRLALMGKKKNILFISNSYDNAERLLEPYRAHLDTNQRIALYYGDQRQVGHWEAGDFRTKSGATFRACGALQSPVVRSL